MILSILPLIVLLFSIYLVVTFVNARQIAEEEAVTRQK